MRMVLSKVCMQFSSQQLRLILGTARTQSLLLHPLTITLTLDGLDTSLALDNRNPMQHWHTDQMLASHP